MTKFEVRETIRKNLETDIIGPWDGPDERFKEMPTRRYIVGVLYPPLITIDPLEDDASTTDDDQGEEEDATQEVAVVQMRDRLRPSSMGMTFEVAEVVDSVPIKVTYAKYVQGRKNEDYARVENVLELRIPLGDGGKREAKLDDERAFVLRWRTYEDRPKDGRRTLSVFLVNEEKAEKDKGRLPTQCIYSPCLRVEMDDPFIMARKHGGLRNDEQDLRSLQLLYRNRHEFGVGHGCSVAWDGTDGLGCSRLWTTFLPTYLQSRPTFLEDVYRFPMNDLADRSRRQDSICSMGKMLDDYGRWYDRTFSQEERDQAGDLKDVFDRHKDLAQESLSRMRSGISMIESSNEAFEAFCFMNEVMHLQAAHGIAIRRRDPNAHLEPKLETKELPAWRPFQLAFILQTIPDILDPRSHNRDILDLLWVSTGGGKTEAYLGLTAFTLAIRRLRASGKQLPDYAGVSVIMRYTLRLLTIQQFQRATRMICACEVVRRRNIGKWGSEPFLVGLYVGSSSTPNRIGHKSDYDKGKDDTAFYAIEHWRRKSSPPQTQNPFQLLECPWCGTKLDRYSYSIDESKGFLITHCPKAECPFGKEKAEIPAITVDENIYSRLPSLLISTIDKFAQLPFKPELGALFGHVDRYCAKHGFLSRTTPHSVHRDAALIELKGPLNPPDLIIQDELHLINGPLGSIAGMYETTVDHLCRRPDRKGPKHIASTATIRHADEQAWYLYLKKVRSFPASGSDYSDSFFVREEGVDQGSKMFIGLFPSGIGQKTAMIRTMSSLLRTVAKVKASGVPLEDWDEYWTIISYFNSIRELGGAKTTFEDDVKNHVLQDRRSLTTEELTSRKTSKELPEILAQMELKGDSKGALDIVACSNMFSVGVDVPRLGLMVMNNQPKSTSEYIQSTGRVGRSKTGLVIVLYNWARPRDQSHFERFYDYHNRIQSHVEAMTVTPFSSGVRERALHAQYVSMVRITGDRDIANNDAACKYGHSHVQSGAEFVRVIRNRANEMDLKVDDEIRGELDSFTSDWLEANRRTGNMVYKDYGFNGPKPSLMVNAEEDIGFNDGVAIKTPNSMRNVEKQISMKRIWGMKQ